MGTILTDGKKTVEITMKTWDGSQWGVDWSNDFFEIGSLPAVELEDGTTAHKVEDVDYCMETAEDWSNKRGDFADDGKPEAEDRGVWFADFATIKD